MPCPALTPSATPAIWHISSVIVLAYGRVTVTDTAIAHHFSGITGRIAHFINISAGRRCTDYLISNSSDSVASPRSITRLADTACAWTRSIMQRIGGVPRGAVARNGATLVSIVMPLYLAVASCANLKAFHRRRGEVHRALSMRPDARRLIKIRPVPFTTLSKIGAQQPRRWTSHYSRRHLSCHSSDYEAMISSPALFCAHEISILYGFLNHD